jgi:hypothetical protein
MGIAEKVIGHLKKFPFGYPERLEGAETKLLEMSFALTDEEGELLSTLMCSIPSTSTRGPEAWPQEGRPLVVARQPAAQDVGITKGPKRRRLLSGDDVGTGSCRASDAIGRTDFISCVVAMKPADAIAAMTLPGDVAAFLAQAQQTGDLANGGKR